MRRVLLSLWFVAAVPLCVGARQGAVFPDGAALRAAADYSKQAGGVALMVWRGERLVFERFGSGYGRDTRHKIFSGTKTFWTAAALAAQAEGILDLDERVSDIIPEWRAGAKREITLRQLLQCASGLEPGFRLHREGFADRNRVALGLALVAAPGRAFLYGPSHGQVFLEALERRLRPRGQTAWGYLGEKVLAPAGLRNFPVRRDRRGMPLWATGFELSAAEWGAFGRALVSGNPGLAPPGGLAEAFAPSPANPAFGLCFWLNAGARQPGARVVEVEEELDKDWREQRWRGAVLSVRAPEELLAAVGSYGQRLYLVPTLRLVVVRLGRGREFRDEPFLDRLFGGGGVL